MTHFTASPRGAMEARRFPEPEVVGSIPTAGDTFPVAPGDGLCGGVAQMVERSLSMREVQGSIPCISSFCAAADVPKRLRGWTRNPLGSARAGSSPAVCDFWMTIEKATPGGTRTHNLWLREPTPYPLGYRGFRMEKIAPPVGLEPTTTRLRALRSTD